MGGLDDIDVGGDGVGGVLLLDVGEDGDVLGADGLAVAEKRAGAGVHVAFVGHVPKDEAFGADEIGAGGEGGGKGFPVGAGEDLDAEGKPGMGLLDFAGDDRHGDGDFGTGMLHVGDVVHVFDHEGMDAAGAIGFGLGEGLVEDGGHAAPMLWRAGQGAHVDHADDDFGAGTEEAGENGSDHGGARG